MSAPVPLHAAQSFSSIFPVPAHSVQIAGPPFAIFSSPAPIGGSCARAGCHSGARPSGGLSLESYARFLAGGDATRQDPASFPIVVPFEPVTPAMMSYIIRRIDTSNTGFRAPRMPSGAPALSIALIDRLKRWISQGALDN